ncbi:MAG: hypothetical protein V7640_1598 [Betaproteobacteria bacterium]
MLAQPMLSALPEPVYCEPLYSLLVLFTVARLAEHHRSL